MLFSRMTHLEYRRHSSTTRPGPGLRAVVNQGKFIGYSIVIVIESVLQEVKHFGRRQDTVNFKMFIKLAVQNFIVDILMTDNQDLVIMDSLNQIADIDLVVIDINKWNWIANFIVDSNIQAYFITSIQVDYYTQINQCSMDN